MPRTATSVAASAGNRGVVAKLRLDLQAAEQLLRIQAHFLVLGGHRLSRLLNCGEGSPLDDSDVVAVARCSLLLEHVALEASVHPLKDGVCFRYNTEEFRFRGGWNNKSVDSEDLLLAITSRHLDTSILSPLNRFANSRTRHQLSATDNPFDNIMSIMQYA